MELQACVLCESAQVNEDHSVTVVRALLDRGDAPEYPADLAITLFAAFEADDRDEARSFSVIVLDEQLQRVGGAELGTFALARDLEPGQCLKVPVVVPLSGIALPAPGNYEIRLLVDSDTVAALPFRAMPA